MLGFVFGFLSAWVLGLGVALLVVVRVFGACVQGLLVSLLFGGVVFVVFDFGRCAGGGF